MSRSQPGYALPEDPQPDGFYCVKLFIPAADRYLYALAGAFTYFGKWVAWERDGTDRATLAAQSWQVAIQKTFDEAWLNCGEDDVCEHCDLIPVILERLEELSNMNVTVNCGSGCGCGSQPVNCIPVSDVALPPDTLPPNPMPGTPSPSDPEGVAWKCNMAHYITYLIRLWGINSTVGNGVSLIMSSVDHVYDGLLIPPPPLAQQIAVSGVATMLNAGGSSDMVVVPFDASYDAIVCAIYNATTDAMALQAMQDVFAAIYDNALVGQAMSILATILPFERMFTPDVITVLPPSYRSRSCDCGTAVLPPPPPDDYVWLPVAPNHLTFVERDENGSPVDVVADGYVRHGHGVGYNRTLYDIEVANILADGRLPGPGTEVAAIGLFLTEASFSGTPGSGVFEIWQIPSSGGIDWYLTTGTIPTPVKSCIIHNGDSEIASLIPLFNYAGVGVVDVGSQFFVDSQGGGVMASRCNYYWLVKL